MLSARWRRGCRCAAALAVTLTVAALALTATAPAARADSVRNAQMWVLDAVRAPAAWQVSKGRGVTVAVIDSGVNPDVSDLAGSVSTGPDYTGVHTPESNPNWGVHGTWMASLIAGHGHDGGSSGIFGVAPKAHVLSIRVITDSSDPAYPAYSREPQSEVQGALADAISYAVYHGAGVISMALGYGAPSLQVRKALQNAFNHGVVVVASSGNSGDTARKGNAPYSFPADYPGVIGVAALNQNGAPAGFSSNNISVQVAAPGVNVPAQGRNGQYWLVSGTSPACALTAGVAALIKSAYPALPADLVRRAITSTTTHRPAGGYNEEVGFGTVDAAAALTAAAQLAASPLAGPGGSGSPSAANQPGAPDSSTLGTAGSGRNGSAGTHSHGSALQPASSPLSAGVAAAAHFGGGPAAVPPAPVAPRGTAQLLLLCLLGFFCMALVGVSMSHLALARRSPAAAAARARSSSPRRFPWSARPPGRHASPTITDGTRGPHE